MQRIEYTTGKYHCRLGQHFSTYILQNLIGNMDLVIIANFLRGNLPCIMHVHHLLESLSMLGCSYIMKTQITEQEMFTSVKRVKFYLNDCVMYFPDTTTI